jgi:hypothetical protein
MHGGAGAGIRENATLGAIWHRLHRGEAWNFGNENFAPQS